MTKNYKMFSFNILLVHYKKLKEISKRELVPMSHVINNAIREYIKSK